ncbi:MAG: TonB-dependent receptor [Gemmatimonadaceae bacterium]|nr:TonB-dependent receptor [Gemmatimonadaceae bacterium]
MGLALPAAAQTGSISGRVTSGGGRGIPDVTVTAAIGDVAGTRAVTGSNGEYRISGLSAGIYTVTTIGVGYQPSRLDGVNVGAGASAMANFSLTALSILQDVVTTVSRRQEKATDAPASVSVVSAVEINERPSINVADHVVAQPGVDVARGGVMQANIVTRGFNNIFSGALLTLTDNRFAFVPSLRVNIPYLQSTTNEDIERVEIVLGPGAALYGPNTAGGVMHVITKSPFNSQGTTLTVDGGERSIFRGAVRHAGAPTEKIAYKISYDYFQGNEWRPPAVDPLERVPRDFDLKRQGGEARVDFRPTPGSEIIGTYGRSMANSVEPTGLGPAQVKDWVVQNYQLRGRVNQLFAQVFLNTSDAGETFLLRTLNPIIDKSKQFVGQIQHGLDFGERQSFLYGIDYLNTNPDTEGSINGRNEDDDEISETGAYLHSVTRLSPKFEVTAAARLDKHSRLDDAVFSPRLALVFKPVENQNLRATYNRAFSTPSTLNLFLDLQAGRIPASGTQLFGVRALGVPSDGGLKFKRDAATGGVGGLFMRAGAFPGAGLTTAQIPANASSLYRVAVGAAASSLIAGGIPAGVVQFLGTLQPTPAQVGTTLRILNTSNGTFNDVDPTAIQDVDPIKPTTNTTFEVGYKGILGGRFQLGLDVWHENRRNFVGPLIVETPNVFLDRASLQAFLLPRLTPVVGPAAGAIATAVAGALGGVSGGTGAAIGVPLGVVNFDNDLSNGSDVIVTYRNFGELNVFGSDFAAELLLDGGMSLQGTYSWVNKDFFPREEIGGGVQDISLNAPKSKGSLAARYRSPTSSLSGELRGRYVAEFPVFSFINGTIPTYTLFDAGFSVRPEFLRGALFSLNATNLLNKKHIQFVGGGEIGRLIMTRLQVTF